MLILRSGRGWGCACQQQQKQQQRRRRHGSLLFSPSACRPDSISLNNSGASICCRRHRSQTKTRARRSGPEINFCCLSCGSRNTRKLTAQRSAEAHDRTPVSPPPCVCWSGGEITGADPAGKTLKVAAPHNSLSLYCFQLLVRSEYREGRNNAMTA